MTLKELAKYLRLNERTIYRLDQNGDFIGFKVGGSWQFAINDIDTWIEDGQHNPE